MYKKAINVTDMMNTLMRYFKGQPEKQFELFLMNDHEIRIMYNKLPIASKEQYE